MRYFARRRPADATIFRLMRAFCRAGARDYVRDADIRRRCRR